LKGGGRVSLTWLPLLCFQGSLGGSNFLQTVLATGLLLVVTEVNWKVTWALLD
jgi:hypothetical protein